MFRLSCEELKRRRTAKRIQSTKEMFEALGFDNLVDPGVKVEISTVFHEVFKWYARIVNPKGGGEKVYAFDAHRLVESMCQVWADLYGTIATSQEKVLQYKDLLEQEVKKLSKGEEERVIKLAGELNVCHQQLRAAQDSLMERGTTITQL